MFDRRKMMTMFGWGAAAGAAGLLQQKAAAADAQYVQATRGLPKLKLANVKAILTSPERARLVVVKVDTSEPGLYGLGFR